MSVDPLESTQIEKDINERVLVGDRALVAQLGSLDAKFFGKRVDAFGGRALVVKSFVGITLSVELIAKASACARGNFSLATTFGPVGMGNGTALPSGFWVKKGRGISFKGVRNKSVFLLEVGAFEREREVRLTERSALFIEGASIVGLAQRNSGKATSLMKVVVNIVSIKSGIESTKAGFVSQTRFGAFHQGMKVSGIASIEGLGHLSQDKLAPLRHFGGDEARGIAPVEFTRWDVTGSHALLSGSLV